MKYFLRTFLALLVLATLTTGASAQGGRGGRQGRLSQLENAKIAYLTDKISLTQDQAQKFWPVYNEFTDKRRDLNKRLRLLRMDNADGLTDQQIKDNLVQGLALRQSEVNLEKEYFEKFQKVLTIRQVGKLFVAERQFTKEVLRRVAGGQGGAAQAGADD